MEKLTQCLQGLFWLVLLTAPSLLQAQSWQWASAPTAIVDPSSTGGQAGSNITGTVLDAAGNTVVTGYFYGSITLGSTTLTSAGGSDVFVARLNSSGQWLQAIQAGGPGDDNANALVLDATGNAVVGGTFGHVNGSTTTATFGATTLATVGTFGFPDAFVAQLSPNGQWLQAVRTGGPDNDWLPALALDGAGNVVVLVTSSFPAGSAQFAVTKLNLSTGTWTPLNQVSNSSAIQPNVMALDATGNIVIGGNFGGSASFGTTTLVSNSSQDMFVARMSAGGQWTQAVQVPQSGNSSAPPCNVKTLAVDGAGTVTIAGILVESATFGSTTLTFQRTGSGIYDVFVARLSAAGQWTQALQAGGPQNDIVNAMTVDAAGNTIIAGLTGPGGAPTGPLTATFGATTLTSVGGYDVFVATLSPSGQWLQAACAGGLGGDVAYAVAVDAAGNITVAGGCGNPANFGNISLASTSSYGMAFVARLAPTITATRAATLAETFTLAPNPAGAAVRLTWPETSTVSRTIQVFDAMGREAHSQELPARASTAMLDAAGLAPGLYMVRCAGAAARLVIE